LSLATLRPCGIGRHARLDVERARTLELDKGILDNAFCSVSQITRAKPYHSSSGHCRDRRGRPVPAVPIRPGSGACPAALAPCSSGESWMRVRPANLGRTRPVAHAALLSAFLLASTGGVSAVTAQSSSRTGAETSAPHAPGVTPGDPNRDRDLRPTIRSPASRPSREPGRRPPGPGMRPNLPVSPGGSPGVRPPGPPIEPPKSLTCAASTALQN